MSCKYQIKLSSEILKVAKEGWNPSNPAGIHWDGKIMHTLKNKNAIEDRLLATKQFYNKTSLLINILSQFLRFEWCETSYCSSIASTKPYGELTSNTIMSLLNEWKCTGNISSMVFDTTASSTDIIEP